MSGFTIGLVVAAAVSLTSSLGFPSPESKSPYAKLFQPRASDLRELSRAQPAQQTPSPTMPHGAHEPQIDCKIRVIPVDPSIDRGIQMSNRSAETQFAIRVLEHPCLKR
jgi:hypothetical protein